MIIGFRRIKDSTQIYMENGSIEHENRHSDAHEGLKAAAAKVLSCTWQRCKVHFLRNALAHAGKGQRQMVLALINTIFAQETPEAASEQWRAVADQLRERFPKLAEMMDEAEPDVLAFMGARRRIERRSTAPIPWSGSMPRSSAEPTSSGSSPTRRPSLASSAPCCSSRTTSGSSSVATCSLKDYSRPSTIKPLGCRLSSTEHEFNRAKTHDSYTTDGDVISRFCVAFRKGAS